jgi:hypothetical protein
MSQWYQKVILKVGMQILIAREFHGVWEILMSKLRSINVLGGTGLLTKQNEIGFGYQDQGVVVNVPKKSNVDLAFCTHGS